MNDDILAILLKDYTTGKNILWGTDNYDQITLEQAKSIKPRWTKAKEAQDKRTKKKAEVFTPSWLCNVMNNSIDEEWFGRSPVFNVEKEKSWETIEYPIKFPEGKTCEEYVQRTCLEITCGEAPFLVSRYDSVSGEEIPIKDRIGILDRKLRIVSENVGTEPLRHDWWVLQAFRSVYGYEYQGDNLLLGRLNLLNTYIDYMVNEFNQVPTDIQLKLIAECISRNIVQMDGLTCAIPNHPEIPVLIMDWKNRELVEFRELKD